MNSKLGGTGDRFGDDLCADCAYLTCPRTEAAFSLQSQYSPPKFPSLVSSEYNSRFVVRSLLSGSVESVTSPFALEAKSTDDLLNVRRARVS